MVGGRCAFEAVGAAVALAIGSSVLVGDPPRYMVSLLIDDDGPRPINAEDVTNSGAILMHDGLTGLAWVNGKYVPLELPNGVGFFSVRAMNESGVVAGDADFRDRILVQPALWSHGEVESLSGMVEEQGSAMDVNDLGEAVASVVLMADLSPDSYRWRSCTATSAA